MTYEKINFKKEKKYLNILLWQFFQNKFYYF